MKKNKLLWMGVLLMAVIVTLSFTNCASSDSDEDDSILTDSLIIGEWELKTLLPLGGDCDPGVVQEIPSGQRDIFIFSSKGKVKVIKKKRFWIENWPIEDGEYDYSYDKEKQTIQLCGKTWRCMITDGKMQIEQPLGELRQYFIFIKKTDLEGEGSEYVPLVKAGKVWKYGPSGNRVINIQEFFSGDTIINGKSYMKLYRQYMGSGKMDYLAALREQDRKVYCVLSSKTEEWLAYDFNLTVGEEFRTSEILPWNGRTAKAVLTSISSYELDNDSCRMLNFDVYQSEPYNYPNSTSWIEGVGALNCPVYEWMTYVTWKSPKDGPDGGPVLYYCEDNGKLLYNSSHWP